MKFEIDKIILWPKRNDKKYREINFCSNSINVITGASRTGKSSIIPIIDYCLGSKKCTIPVYTIRDVCEWFGILIKLEDEEILLCRKEPGEKSTTTEVYIQRDKKVKIPERVIKNSNLEFLKSTLNEIFSMSFLNLNEEENNGFYSRPSYRDIMTFLFQPQNIIANSDVLFYKADTMEHRKKLINIFPYVLGAVTPELLAKKQQLERKEKELKKLKLDYQIIKDNIDSWKSEVGKWLAIAYEYGFIEEYNSDDNFDNMVKKLDEISKKDVKKSKILSNNVEEFSNELVRLRNIEKQKSQELFELQRRYMEMMELRDTSKNYKNVLEIQRERLEVTDWLIARIDNKKMCPICGNNCITLTQKLNDLSETVNKVKKEKEEFNTKIPVIFERELQQVEEEIKRVSTDLSNLRMQIGQKNDYINEQNDTKYTLESMSRFLGKMENAVLTYKRIGKDSILEEKINYLQKEIANLRRDVNQSEIDRKIKEALIQIEQNAERIISHFDTERPTDKIEFLINDLTIRVKNENGRSDYLWQIGSASNWLAYHISILLAFQEFYQNQSGIKIPNFLVIDQPSQVYFPQRSGMEADNEKENDEDKAAVRKIFLAMSQFLKKSNINLQIIVTEHADKSIWQGIDNVIEIERWRNGNSLVPLDWLEKDCD